MKADALLTGLIEVRGPSSTEPEVADLQEFCGTVWKRKQEVLGEVLALQALPRAKAQLHRLFRTGSDALVVVCSIDSDQDARCHVLLSGKRSVVQFGRQGYSYWIYADGTASKRKSLSNASGDWLREALAWNIAMPAESEWDLGWLCEPVPLHCDLSHPGIWQTQNGSIVAVSRRLDNSWGATVMRGGARLSDPSKKWESSFSLGSDYVVSTSGAVSIPEVPSAASVAALDLVCISGMALARSLPISDEHGKSVVLPDIAGRAGC